MYQRGYEVHGILMKIPKGDWKDFQSYDVGYNEADLVHVIPYQPSSRGTLSSDVDKNNGNMGEDDDTNDENDDAAHDSLVEDMITPPAENSASSNSIQAYAMTMKEYDESKLDSPIEQLPTERYLKLIANGMREYKVDEDYVMDQIMSVPYIPSCQPNDYRTIPFAKQRNGSLPKISLAKYYKLCRKNSGKKDGGDVYFVIHRHVIKLGPHDPQHPAAMWVKERLHGQRDATWINHQSTVEPSLPPAERLEDLTLAHHAWFENHAMEFARKSNLTLEKVYELIIDEDNNNHDIGDSSSRSSLRKGGERRRSWLPERLTRGTRHSMSSSNREQLREEDRRPSLPNILLHGSGFFRRDSRLQQHDDVDEDVLASVQQEIETLGLADNVGDEASDSSSAQ